MRAFWSGFLKSLTSTRSLILLRGEVGAGKTESVSMIAELLGSPSAASSPTFALHQSYSLSSGLFLQIEHFDLYRIESEEDLEGSGFWDVFSADQKLVIVEWPERVPKQQWPLDFDIFNVEILKVNEEARMLRVSRV